MRSSPAKILLTTVAIAAALAACQRREDKAKPAQPTPPPAGAANGFANGSPPAGADCGLMSIVTEVGSTWTRPLL